MPKRRSSCTISARASSARGQPRAPSRRPSATPPSPPRHRLFAAPLFTARLFTPRRQGDHRLLTARARRQGFRAVRTATTAPRHLTFIHPLPSSRTHHPSPHPSSTAFPTPHTPHPTPRAARRAPCAARCHAASAPRIDAWPVRARIARHAKLCLRALRTPGVRRTFPSLYGCRYRYAGLWSTAAKWTEWQDDWLHGTRSIA